MTGAEPEESVLLMGFGTGGHSLLRFVDQLLPSLLWLQNRVRAVILVNTVLKYGPSFKRTCKVTHFLPKPNSITILTLAILFPN